MAALDPIQTATLSNVTITGGNQPFNVTVTAGSTLLLGYAQATTGDRTWTVSDNVNGAWTSIVDVLDGTGARSGVWKFENTTGGSIIITLTAGASATNNMYAVFVELPASTVVDFSSFYEASTSATTHYCAAAGKLDAGANSVVLSGGVLHASGGTLSTPTGFTSILNTDRVVCQWDADDAGFTDQRSLFTSTTSRRPICWSVALTQTGGGGSVLPIIMQQLGA